MAPLKSEESLKALVALRTHNEFLLIVQELGLLLEFHHQQLLYQKDVNAVYNAQGAVRILTEILDAVHHAPANLQKVQNRS